MPKGQICVLSLVLGAAALYVVQKSTGKLLPR